MSVLTRKSLLLWLAAGLIVAVNLIAVGGVAYNRSGEDSRLEFSQRELELPYWQAGQDNSGIALSLRWRTPLPPENDADADAGVGNGWQTAAWGSVEWLDSAKMRALGFPEPPQDADAVGYARAPAPLAREVWLALEFNGNEYARSLAAAQVAHDRAQAALVTAPIDNAAISPDETAAEQQIEAAAMVAAATDKTMIDRAKAAAEHLRVERDESSRLFAVDAGLDPAGLRQRYPQRDRFLIASGRVRPGWNYLSLAASSDYMAGRIDGINIDSIHVPLQFRAVFEPHLGKTYDLTQTARYQLTVVYGRRFEPWIEAARGAD